MVRVGDILEHEKHGQVEVLGVEEKMVMDRTGSSRFENRVKFLRIDDELAHKNFLRESVSSFDEATENPSS